MRFELTFDARRLGSYLPAFSALAGEERWRKRAVQLSTDCLKSLWARKIIADYHWLEIELAARHADVELNDTITVRVSPRTLAALRFAATIVEVHRRLSPAGQVTIQGRLRDALKTGFPALYLEMELAQLLMEDGFDVAFPDLEGEGNFDLQFTKAGIAGEIECKSQSVDAGRKIHRRDFYRFIEDVSAGLMSRVESGAQELLVVSVVDRFPHEHNRRRELVEIASRVLSEPACRGESCNWFNVERRPLGELGTLLNAGTREFYNACRGTFGEQCHVAGPVTDSGACLVVAYSQQEDDTSKPLLEAMKKAHQQLSSTRPGVVAVQFNDIESQTLALPHFRRRSAILCAYLFGSHESEQLAAVYFCGYAGMNVVNGTVGTPAFACWNPRLASPVDGLPFRHSISNDDFARMLGVSSP